MSNLDESVTGGLPPKAGGKPPSSRRIAKINSRTASAANSEKEARSNRQMREKPSNQNIGSAKTVGSIIPNDKRKAM